MINLKEKIKDLKVPKSRIGLVWLGLSCFVIKLPNNKLLIIDPWFSDICQKEYGETEVAVNRFKRMFPPLLDPSDISPNYVFSSHNHYDHFDIYSIPKLLEKADTVFGGPKTCIEECMKKNIGKKNNLLLLEENKEVIFDDFKIVPVYCDHGDLAPDALGFIFNFESFKLYFVGDSAYRPDKIDYIKECKPDIVIAPINGMYGNLGPEEAAKLARDISAKFLIPCHYWAFIEHGGNPLQLAQYMKKYSPECEYAFPSIGEVIIREL